MSKARFTEEFKVAAVKQVAEHGRPVAEVAARLVGGQLSLKLNKIDLNYDNKVLN